MTRDDAAERRGMLIIACGALAHEITALRRANGWDQLDVRCLPAELHNRPEKIPDAVRALIRCVARPLPLDLRGLRRLRHGRAARRGAARGGRRAHPGRALLRVLRHGAGIRRARGGANRAPSISRIFCCGISSAWSSAVWGSIGIRNCSRSTSATTASSSIWRRRRSPRPRAQARAIAARMGLAIRISSNRLRDARRRRWPPR